MPSERYAYEQTHPYYKQDFKCLRCGHGFVGRTGRKFCSRSCHNKTSINLGRMKVGLEAIQSPMAQDIAWAAGIYEGEGACSKKQALAIVAQKDPWLLYKMQRLFGGSIAPRKKAQFRIYNWCVTGSRARGFLMTIYRFLSPRRKAQVNISLGVSGVVHA